MSKKICVLDTNVLIHNPWALQSFEDNVVVVPITVIEELDKLKSRPDEVGSNARETVRILDGLRSKGSLFKGVKTESGGIIRIDLNNKKALGKFPPGIDFSVPDNRILSVAYNLTKKEAEKKKKGKPFKAVWVVSKDLNMRVKADAMGLLVNDYTGGKIKIEELYSGWRNITVSSKIINRFRLEKILLLKEKFFPNEFVHLVDEDNPKKNLRCSV